MRTGRTLTRHFDLETRQHELLGLDLGEGVPRRTLLVGLLAFGTWVGLLLALFGVPSPQWASAYLLPPGLLTVLGSRRSRVVDRRRNLTCWGIAARYVVAGHEPVICGGRRTAGPGERIACRDRLAVRAERAATMPLFAPWTGRLDHASPTAREPRQTPLAWSHRARLYGPDATAKNRARRRAPHVEEGGSPA